ncbi:MAG: dihydroorotase [Clostridiales bacterium]|mgnify:CR=1 FL=1|nr:dihydroorotase [Clostridiales bacterium]
MRYVIQGVTVHNREGRVRRDLVLTGGRLRMAPGSQGEGPLIPVTGRDLHLFPGFTDVHVHLREPGFSYKETIRTGTRAAARGGFTTLVTMPNLNPVPDSLETLDVQQRLIADQALVRVIPLGAITKSQQGQELADMDDMSDWVAGFSDDGRGVQTRALMLRAMREARRLNQIIVAHCEDEALTQGGWIHDGDWARAHGHTGNPSQSEWRQVARDLALARQAGCKYHVCHVSTRESVALLRQAKAQGLDVSCETAPHYLLLDDSQLKDHGRFKMNPPIRARADREALVAGLIDGTVDMVATDHAPHSPEEKSGGLRHSLNGVVGLETAFATLYTGLVLPGTLSLERLLDALVYRPQARFGIAPLEDWTLFDLGAAYDIQPDAFQSLGRATPFEGQRVHGQCLLTIHKGRAVWQDPAVFPQEAAE